MKKQKYEVVDYVSGGFFIHGGSLTEMYIKNKDEAELICEALNTVERLKTAKFLRNVDNAIASMEDLARSLRQD